MGQFFWLSPHISESPLHPLSGLDLLSEIPEHPKIATPHFLLFPSLGLATTYHNALLSNLPLVYPPSPQLECKPHESRDFYLAYSSVSPETMILPGTQ